MNLERINAALQKVADTRRVAIGVGVRADVDGLFAQSFAEQPAVVVADATTFAVAGEEIHQRLGARGRTVFEPIVFPSQPMLYADYRHVLALEDKLRGNSIIPVAVGSGTLNDITKLAAHHCGKPYMVVATAASMDGYTAFGAPITRDGFKQTFSCPAPRVVVADLDILVHAPLQMTAAGYADLLGKVTAGGDWLISDALAIEPLDPQAWSLVQDSLASWTASPRLLQSGDRQAIEHLIEGLIVVGVAMQIHRSSRPAAGCEHQFSHLWEMQEQTHGVVSHGFKVGV